LAVHALTSTEVLDARVYRTAFLPALVALFVAAFALADRPAPARNAFPTDVFSAERAFGSGTPEPESLQGMAAAFPDRTAGSAGDTGLAQLVQQVFEAPEEQGERAAFTVRRDVVTARDRDLINVVATRAGFSTRRIVVMANRDGPGAANLSATAVLLELARVLKTRELDKTIVLVSSSGSRQGFAGAKAWAESEAGGPVDGVLVLGDMAGVSIEKPWVVSWTGTAAAPSLGLERTVQAAVRREVRSAPGGPRALGQWARRALPIAISDQAPVARAGLPAVLLSETGELGPAADEPVDEDRLDAFGRAALGAIGAIDSAGPREGQAFANAPSGIVTLRNVLTDWSVRLVIGSLLLPAVLAALDAFFRARRRRVPIGPWLAWLAVIAVPLPVAWAWLRALGATGVIDAPDGPVLPDRFPLETAGWVAMGSALLAGALACVALRFAVGALRVPAAPAEDANGGRRRPVPGVEGLAVATGVWLCGLAALAWVANPYAAGVLVLATHLWLFAAGGWRARWALPAIAVGLLPVLAIAVHYGFALDLGPVDLAWGSALAATAGAGLWSTLLVGGLLAALAGAIRAVFARRRLAGEPGGTIRTRGPLSYAGPGSLGGTESALRR
jgi:hypothetical protein